MCLSSIPSNQRNLKHHGNSKRKRSTYPDRIPVDPLYKDVVVVSARQNYQEKEMARNQGDWRQRERTQLKYPSFFSLFSSGWGVVCGRWILASEMIYQIWCLSWETTQTTRCRGGNARSTPKTDQIASTKNDGHCIARTSRSPIEPHPTNDFGNRSKQDWRGFHVAVMGEKKPSS